MQVIPPNSARKRRSDDETALYAIGCATIFFLIIYALALCAAVFALIEVGLWIGRQ